MIVKLLGGAFGNWILAAVAVAFLALAAAATTFYVQRDLARADVVACGGEKATLEGQVAVQNAAVERLAADCKAKAASADVDALRALNSPPPPATGTGPEALNRWLQKRLARP